MAERILQFNQFSLRIDRIRQVIVQDRNNNAFGLVLQCKMKSSEIIVRNNGDVELNNPNQYSKDNYIIPYRLLKKHLENYLIIKKYYQNLLI